VKIFHKSELPALAALLCWAVSAAPVSANESLAALGTSNFTILDSTTSLSQGPVTLSMNSAAVTTFFVGQFSASYNWTGVSSLGLFMSATGASPDVLFTVEFFDSNADLINLYEGYASGLNSTPTFLPLSLWSSGNGNFSAVSYLYFTWNGDGPGPVILHSVAGSLPGVAWASAGGSAWLAGTNWAGGATPNSTSIAQFGANPVSGVTPVGIDMGSNGGAQSVGAIEVTAARSASLLINNSAASVSGTLTLNGATVNGAQNVILRNNSAQLLTLSNGATANMGVALGNVTDNVVAIDGSGGITIGSSIFGSGRRLTKSGSGAGVLTLSGANTFGGGVYLTTGTLRLSSPTAAGTGLITQSPGTILEIDTTGSVTNAMSVHNVSVLQTVTLSGAKTLNNATFTVATGTTTTESGALSGSGGLTKEGAGTLLVTGNNSYEGSTAVNAGMLQLDSASGSAAGFTASVSVGSGAILLLSRSGQVNDSAEVSLSGGTIRRAAGVNEVFGLLTLYDDSFLDFGTGAMGELRFGEYTPSALLTVYNFLPGNRLVFVGSDLSGSIDDTGLFSFQGGFQSAWDEGTGTFTVTAIPEPSAWVAAVLLVVLMGWAGGRRVEMCGKRQTADGHA